MNQITFNLESIYEFLGDELILYKDPDDNKIYCFHVSEIPQIIKTKSNPWSNKPISDNILREWLEKLEVFPQYTLEDAIKKGGVFDKHTSISVSTQDKLENLGKLINANNRYVNILDIQNLPNNEIFILFRVLYGVGVPGGIVPMDFQYVSNLYLTNNREGLLNYLYDIIYTNIRNNKLSISTFALIFNEIITDYSLVEQMHQIVGEDFSWIKPILDTSNIPLQQFLELTGPEKSKLIRDAILLRIERLAPEDAYEQGIQFSSKTRIK